MKSYQLVQNRRSCFRSVPKLPTFAIEKAMRNRVSSRTPVLIRPSWMLIAAAIGVVRHLRGGVEE